MGLRFEVWTLPWSASFQRKIADLPVVAGSGSGMVRFNDIGEGSVGVPPGYDRLDEIVSDTVGSLIRVYDGSTIVHEFLAERVDRIQSEEIGATISGADLKSAFDKAIVYPYDYPTNSFPDHIWAGQNILQNPNFEDNDQSPTVYELYTTATGGTFTLSDGTDTTSAIAYNAAPATVETRIQTDLATTTDVLVTGSGTSSDPWIIEFVDPKFGVTLTVNGGSLTGGSATLTRTQAGQLEPSGWTKSQQVSFGVPKTFGDYTTFALSTDFADSGTYSLKIDPATIGNRYAGAQQVVRVTPGGTYQASIKVRTTSGTNKYRFVIRTINGDLIATTSESTYATGSWHTVTLSDLVIPDGVTEVIFRFANVDASGNPSAFYLDTAQLLEGQAAATVGTIVGSLMDDATSDHSGDTRGTLLTWVDYSGFSATLDSSAASWDASLSFTAYRGMTYGQVFDRLVALGYEWDLVPKATPSGGDTHDLEWYNPAGRDDAPSTAVNAGQGTIGGSVVKRIPDYTAVLVEGADTLFHEDTDATALTNFGRLEAYLADRGLADTTTLTAAGDAFLNEEANNRTAVQVQITASDLHPRPLVDYKPGDTIWFQLPPALARTQRRVRQVAWQNTEPATYQVTGSRVFDAESGAWEAIRKILRRFRPFEEAKAGGAVSLGGGGGMMTVAVAASNASDLSKSKADYVCTGVNDQSVIQAAIDSIPTTEDGKVWLSEGDFNLVPTVGTQAITLRNGVSLQGSGMHKTWLNQSGSGSSSTSLVVSQGSNRISDLAIDTTSYTTTDTGLLLSGSTHFVDHVQVYAWDGVGINCDGGGVRLSESYVYCYSGKAIYSDLAAQLWISRCWLTSPTPSSTGYTIHLQSSSADVWITDNLIDGGYHGLYVDASSSGAPSRITVADNYFASPDWSAIRIEDPDGGGSYITITNNKMLGAGQGASGSSNAALHIIGTPAAMTASSQQYLGIMVSNNVIESANAMDGVRLYGIHGARIHNNLIEEAERHGIYVDSSNDNIIANNTIAWPGAINDTYDGIYMTHGTAVVGSSRNYVVGNQVYDDSYVSRDWRYGINVSGTACADNIIVGNDLRNASGSTGTAIADTGTGTLLSWPNDVTYGDNFT